MAENSYMTQKGDIPWKPAKEFKTNVKDLASLNGIKKPDLIRSGATLKRPDIAQPWTSGVRTNTAAAEDSGGTTEQPEWKSTIDEIYENSKKAQLGTLEGQYNTQTAEYEKQRDEAPKTFDPLRNEAYVNAEMAERSRKESMANMGLSGAGGSSQTLQQRNTNTLLSTLGNISREQLDFTNNVNFALEQLATKYDSDRNSITAQIDSEKNRAYLDQGNWVKSFGLQEDQLNLTKKDSEFNKYFELYKKRLITKRQLKEKFPEYFK